MIGGNINAVLQQKTDAVINDIGEKVHQWNPTHELWGWMDLMTGDSKYNNDAKLQESTHVFIMDYVAMDRNADDKRLICNGITYDVLLIDDPLELHHMIEIYLKRVG